MEFALIPTGLEESRQLSREGSTASTTSMFLGESPTRRGEGGPIPSRQQVRYPGGDMRFFIGPDGKEYDLHSLPAYVVVRGDHLFFKTDDVVLFTFLMRGDKLPQRIADWDVSEIASSTKD